MITEACLKERRMPLGQQRLEALEEKEYHLRTLMEVSRELARAPHEEAILRIALSTMVGAVGALGGLALTPSSDENCLVATAAQGLDRGAARLRLELAAGTGCPTPALREPLVLHSARQHADAEVQACVRLLARRGLRVWVPLVAEGELLGGVCLGPRLTGDRYSRADLQLLATIAAQCAASIQGYRLLAAHLLAQEEKFRMQAVLEEHFDPQIVTALLDRTAGPRSHRCTATLLVADLRGFTAASGQLQPEEVVGILNCFLGSMTRVVGAHGGVIDKFIGDAVMAYFNDAEGDAARAVECAFAMQEAFHALQPTPAGPFADVFAGGMGIGISTGEVVWGDIGSARRVDTTVIGMPVNLAHRLSRIARGGILADARTFVTLEATPGATRLPAVAVKGLAGPVPVYQLLETGGSLPVARGAMPGMPGCQNPD